MNLRRTLLVFLAVFALAAPARAAQPILLFLTDFGVIDGAVPACKGVMLSIAPELRIVDLTHENPPYDIETAGEVIEQALPFYPAGTVVVAVVDPGVGSMRKPMAAKTKAGHFLVGPDNGLFTRVLETEGLEAAVELRDAKFWRAPDTTATFHGRDIFSPVGAHLASGTPLASLGPALEPIRLPLSTAKREGAAVVGRVRYVENPYGNVVTDIPMSLIEGLGAKTGDTLAVEIGKSSLELPYRKTFSDVPVGRALALKHSRGPLSFSINQGDFAKAYGVTRGDRVSVRRR